MDQPVELTAAGLPVPPVANRPDQPVLPQTAAKPALLIEDISKRFVVASAMALTCAEGACQARAHVCRTSGRRREFGNRLLA